MKNNKKERNWLEKKLANPRFRKGFDNEYHKLSISEQIVKLRKKSHLTQQELAKKIGTTSSAISRYENLSYDRYEIKTLRKIAEACGGSLRIKLLGPNKENKAA